MRNYYNKKVYARKRAKLNGKLNRKRLVLPKSGGRLVQPVHYYKRHLDYGTVSATNGTTATYGTVYFQLDQLNNYTEFTALYDNYKLIAMKVYFIPISNVTLSGSTPLNVQTEHNNRLITVIDYNDRDTPTNVNELREYSTCQVKPNNILHTRYFHPRPTITMDEDATSGGVYGIGQVKGVWVSTASNQCEWYGVKYGIQHADPTATVSLYKIEVKAYLAFKNYK